MSCCCNDKPASLGSLAELAEDELDFASLVVPLGSANASGGLSEGPLFETLIAQTLSLAGELDELASLIFGDPEVGEHAAHLEVFASDLRTDVVDDIRQGRLSEANTKVARARAVAAAVEELRFASVDVAVRSVAADVRKATAKLRAGIAAAAQSTGETLERVTTFNLSIGALVAVGIGAYFVLKRR